MELLDHKAHVRGLSFSPDEQFHLVSCSNDCTVKFWDMDDDGNMYKTVRFTENTMAYRCKWSPNGRHVAAVGMQKKVSIVAFCVIGNYTFTSDYPVGRML